MHRLIENRMLQQEDGCKSLYHFRVPYPPLLFSQGSAETPFWNDSSDMTPAYSNLSLYFQRDLTSKSCRSDVDSILVLVNVNAVFRLHVVLTES
jgi:hypothetical protein